MPAEGAPARRGLRPDVGGVLGIATFRGYMAGMRIPFVAALFALVSPATAQDAPLQGIGFAQAEEGTWLCRHEDPAEALACAREHCLEQAAGQECIQTAWCYPSGWSGLMTVWLADIHGTQVLCGVAGEKALTDALAALCAANDLATRCELFLKVDPDGNELTVEGVSFPGGAAPPDGDAEPGGRESNESMQ